MHPASLESDRIFITRVEQKGHVQKNKLIKHDYVAYVRKNCIAKAHKVTG